MTHRIVIVGGGAGGLELATKMGNWCGRKGGREARVALVDRNPTHIWKPLLHEVAAGSMDPHTHRVEYAAQGMQHGFEFHQGELTGLDRQARTLRIAAVADDDGEEMLPPRVVHYDTLVIAIGSITHFFGVAGAAEHAIALDTVRQAEHFQKRMIALAMRAHSRASARGAHDGVEFAEVIGETPPPAGPPGVRIAIVGAGATGVELSAELRATAEILSTDGMHRLDPRRDFHITVIEAGPRILPALTERVSTSTAGLLRKLDVQLLTNESVSEVTATDVRTKSGRVVPADLTVWAAGIQAPRILSELDGLGTNRLGQLVVRQTLQTENDEAIFALGDCAACPWLGSERPVPPRAQAAHQQASFVFDALRRRIAGRALRQFVYRDFGSLVSLGHFSAVGSLMGGSMLVEGLFARFMYMSLYRMHVAALHGWFRMLLDAAEDQAALTAAASGRWWPGRGARDTARLFRPDRQFRIFLL
jgi:NADH dehydrogenase